jgi:RNA polymerase primary sigma factor
LDESARLGLLTADEEVQLSRRIQQGDQAAKEAMIMRNLRLIPLAAKKFMHRGMSFEDLFMEGFFGLNLAAELFNPELKYRFSTYAMRAISQNIERALDNKSRAIRIPLHVIERRQKLSYSQQTLMAETGVEPKFDDIVKHSGIPAEQAYEAWHAPEAKAILNVLVGNQEKGKVGDELIDLIPDKSVQINHDADEESIEKSQIKNKLLKAVDNLPDNAKAVIVKMFGLDGGPVYTQKEVSQILGIKPKTLESIYQRTLVELYKDEELRSVIGIKEDNKPDLPDDLPVHIQVGDEIKQFNFQQIRIMAGIRDGMTFKDLARQHQLNLSHIKWMASGSKGPKIYKELGVKSV